MAWQRMELVVAGSRAEELADALGAAGAIATEVSDGDAGTADEEAVFGAWRRHEHSHLGRCVNVLDSYLYTLSVAEGRGWLQ